MAVAVTQSLEPRDAKALTEFLHAYDDLGRAADAPGLWVVYSEAGREYLVDAKTGACECDDSFYRDPEGGCKHARRVAFASGEREIPAWVDRSRVDPTLRTRLDEQR